MNNGNKNDDRLLAILVLIMGVGGGLLAVILVIHLYRLCFQNSKENNKINLKSDCKKNFSTTPALNEMCKATTSMFQAHQNNNLEYPKIYDPPNFKKLSINNGNKSTHRLSKSILFEFANDSRKIAQVFPLMNVSTSNIHLSSNQHSIIRRLSKSLDINKTSETKENSAANRRYDFQNYAKEQKILADNDNNSELNKKTIEIFENKMVTKITTSKDSKLNYNSNSNKNNNNNNKYKVNAAIADFLTVSTSQNHLLRAKSAELSSQLNSSIPITSERFLSVDLENNQEPKRTSFDEATNQRCAAYLGSNLAVKGWRTPKGERRKLPSVEPFVKQSELSAEKQLFKTIQNDLHLETPAIFLARKSSTDSNNSSITITNRTFYNVPSTFSKNFLSNNNSVNNNFNNLLKKKNSYFPNQFNYEFEKKRKIPLPAKKQSSAPLPHQNTPYFSGNFFSRTWNVSVTDDDDEYPTPDVQLSQKLRTQQNLKARQAKSFDDRNLTDIYNNKIIKKTMILRNNEKNYRNAKISQQCQDLWQFRNLYSSNEQNKAIPVRIQQLRQRQWSQQQQKRSIPKNLFTQQSSFSSNGEEESPASFESNSNTVDSTTTTTESNNPKHIKITAESKRETYKLICSDNKNNHNLKSQNDKICFPNILANSMENRVGESPICFNKSCSAKPNAKSEESLYENKKYFKNNKTNSSYIVNSCLNNSQRIPLNQNINPMLSKFDWRRAPTKFSTSLNQFNELINNRAVPLINPNSMEIFQQQKSPIFYHNNKPIYIDPFHLQQQNPLRLFNNPPPIKKVVRKTCSNFAESTTNNYETFIDSKSLFYKLNDQEVLRRNYSAKPDQNVSRNDYFYNNEQKFKPKILPQYSAYNKYLNNSTNQQQQQFLFNYY